MRNCSWAHQNYFDYEITFYQNSVSCIVIKPHGPLGQKWRLNVALCCIFLLQITIINFISNQNVLPMIMQAKDIIVLWKHYNPKNSSSDLGSRIPRLYDLGQVDFSELRIVICKMELLHWNLWWVTSYFRFDYGCKEVLKAVKWYINIWLLLA